MHLGPRTGADNHFTTIEIVCDGPVESVNGHELNRLYVYTDPAETELRPCWCSTAPCRTSGR